jgi:hypothetical protein
MNVNFCKFGGTVIKFRIWDRIDKVFLSWEELFYSLPIGYVDNKNYVIQQFTGLNDKNGKDIYEGDLMKNPHFSEVCQIKYNEFNAAFEVWTNNYQLCSMNGWKNKEIIGNILENPELLVNIK